MSIKVGDKFIIEIGTIAELPDGKKKYFIKPFESLVFDRKGLEQLEKCDQAWENELEKAKLRAYKDGFEHGKLWAMKENAENDNTAINDYNAMIQWLHDCTDDFKEFMNKKYGYDIMYLTNPKVDEGVMLYDLICDHDMAEVISEFQKWQEEKKKAEEESIKVGDIVKFNEKCHSYNAKKNREFLVLHIFDNGLVTILYDNGDTGAVEISLLDKTGRHIDETEQLLDKLKGEEDEKN